MSRKNIATIDWLMLASLVVAWGSSFAMTKLAVAHASASWTMALRLSFAALALVPVAIILKRFALPSLKEALKFSYLAIVGHTAPFFLISWGTRFVPSGISGLLMGAIPLFMVVAAHMFLPNDKLTVQRVLGFACGFFGIVILMASDLKPGLPASTQELRGEIAVLLGCLFYVAHGIVAKRFGMGDPMRQTAYVCGLAAVFGLIWAIAVAPAEPRTLPAEAWLATLGLGLIPTAFASLVMYVLIGRVGPTFTTLSNYLVPIYAVLFGALLFGESLSWTVLASLAFVLAGIAVSRMRPRSSRNL